MSIEVWVKKVAHARESVRRIKDGLDIAERELAASELFQNIVTSRENLKAAREEQASLEAKVREEALEHFGLHGDKKPHPAVAIKQFALLDYDVEMALDWAVRHKIPQVLRLDRRAFEKLAGVIEIEGITQFIEPRAMIARDLSKWVPDVGALPEEDTPDD